MPTAMARFFQNQLHFIVSHEFTASIKDLNAMEYLNLIEFHHLNEQII